ncbi:MAG: cysteine hydrolase [Actinomycetota bacterium]
MHDVTISAEIVERIEKRRGHLHLYDEIEPRSTALVVVDMQNAFCEEDAPAEVPASRGIVDNINRLAADLRAAGGQVIWIVSAFAVRDGRSDWTNFFDNIVSAEVRERTMTNMAPGAHGTLLYPPLDVLDDDTLVEKNRYSCFASGASQLERVLRGRSLDTVLIAGTKTNICCEATARSAWDLDFDVVMVSDCCAALSDREHQSALENTIQQFGDVLTGSEVVARFRQP